RLAGDPGPRRPGRGRLDLADHLSLRQDHRRPGHLHRAHPPHHRPRRHPGAGAGLGPLGGALGHRLEHHARRRPHVVPDRAKAAGRRGAHAGALRLSPAAALRTLERVAREYGEGLAARKLMLLGRLERARLPRAGDVLRLHEALCFLRAYPDDRAVLDQVERMLAAFAGRADLRRHGRALADSGMAGTAIHFRFFSPTAQWLARHWPERLMVDWKAFENDGDLGDLLPLLAHPSEQPGLDEFEFEVRDWVRRLKGPDETDATFLLRRFAALRM